MWSSVLHRLWSTTREVHYLVRRALLVLALPASENAPAPASCGSTNGLARGSAVLTAACVRAQKRQLKRAGQSRRGGGADPFPYMDGGAEASPGCAGLPVSLF